MIANRFFTIIEQLGLNKNKIQEICTDFKLFVRQRILLPHEFFFALIEASTKGESSFNDLAMLIDYHFNKGVSRQAISKKVNHNCQKILQEIVSRGLSGKVQNNESVKVCKHLIYKRIIVQDSTVIRLPLALYKNFSGVSNGHSKSTNARIQVAFDLVSERYVYFSIDPYSKNDIASAPELEIKEDDLVLRDRGYLSVNEVERHIAAKADCIYRYKYKMNLLHIDTHEPIDLLKLLKDKGSLDINVRLNNKDKTVVRLITAPVDKDIANERRRKAKKENHGKSPSKEYLEILSWNLFITTISNDDITYEDFLRIYSLRWRIEIIFKSWKSNLNFSQYHNISVCQLHIMVLARFLMAIILAQFFYSKCKYLISRIFNKDISLIKFIKYLTKYLDLLPEIDAEINHKSRNKKYIYLEKIAKYCCYDKRNDRLNYTQMITNLIA